MSAPRAGELIGAGCPTPAGSQASCSPSAARAAISWRLTVITLTPSSPAMLRSDRLSNTRRRRIAASLAGSLSSSASAETPRLSEVAGSSLSGAARLSRKGRSSAP